MSALRPIDAQAIAAPALPEPGAAPMLQWIEIKHLVVDDSYQRSPHLKVVERIAAAFDWRKFSTVLVAPIEGGLFAVIDGQHRSHAAAACGIEKVPCQVTIMDRAEQARAFAAINGIATPVNPQTMFKAACVAGVEWAVGVRDVCAEANCKALTWPAMLSRRQPGEIMAVGYIRDAIASHGREKVAQSLRIVRRTEVLGADVETYNIAILRPLVEAISTRPHVLKAPDEATVALDEINVGKLRHEAVVFRNERLRAGLPTLGVRDLLESLVGDALDKSLTRSTGAAT